MSNYSTRVETGVNLKAQKKIWKVFALNVRRCRTACYEAAGTFQLLQHECYLLHILLRFHWISMRGCTRRLKLDQSSSKGKLEFPSFPIRQFEWLSQKNILDTDPYIRHRLMQLKSGNVLLMCY